ncbi:hypothetical protein XTALMG727_2914 [Xanthomonas translucens pv. arrhenatheri LMG 727]|uniref:Peptidase S1 domain-containing protein n=2 Tax=Xanthomonas translucens group TaxID=3390202 RepID=A0A0K2ZW01_9XANT|nr:hypothetical protein XTALMG727_2914 [Xanthomonas translucens pv. arrhenatheri LMG 727]
MARAAAWCCLSIAAELASRIGLIQALAHWASSSPYLAFYQALWRVRRTPVAALPCSCDASGTAHRPKESRCESANCGSCLVPSVCSVLAAGRAGLGPVANPLVAHLAVPPCRDHVLRCVRASARHPVPACPPPRLAAGTRSDGLTLHSSASRGRPGVRRSQRPPKEPHMLRLLLLALLVVSFSANAIVIRDDVDDAKYRVPASAFPALVDMPGEGHGVLIAPQWVVSAAHAVTWQADIKQVTLNGISRDVERLVIHPGYKKPPQALLDQALATWDWTLFRVALSSSDDIALLKLARPVTDVAPAALNTRNDEFGQTIKIMGKGATGNGVTGYQFSSSHRTELRRAYNTVSSADGRWFCYTFDKPSHALPLEGGSGSGDSGGPVLLQAGKEWLLAGLTSWSDPQSAIRTPGRYGQISCNVRLSHYSEWIESIISTQP